MALMAMAAGQAQVRTALEWNRLTVGAEFVHNFVQGYSYGNNSILLDHPHNNVDLRVGYDLGRYWTVAVHGGVKMSSRTSELDSRVVADNYTGFMSKSVYVNKPYLVIGMEAHLHLLPLMGVQSPWYDIYAIVRMSYTTQIFGMNAGLGVAYWPWKWGSVFCNVGVGSVGETGGFRDDGWPRFQMRTGISVRL